MRIIVYVMFLLALVLSTSNSALAQLADSPWPMFRNNKEHTGRSNISGPAEAPLLWSYATNDAIFSSPCVSTDGSVYVGSHDNYLYSFDIAGRLSWSYAIGIDVSSSPAVDSSGRIYAMTNEVLFHPANGVYCFSSTGALLWSYRTLIGSWSSPAIGNDGRISVGAWDYLYSVNADGTLHWSYRAGAAPSGMFNSSPALGSGGVRYAGSQNNNLYAVNPNGTLWWSYRTGDFVNSSPVINDAGAVHIGSLDDVFYSFSSAALLTWSYKTGGDIKSSPAMGSDGALYFGSDDDWFYAIASNGSRLWRGWFNGDILSSAAIDAAGTIYCGSSDYRIRALTSGNSLLWSYRTNGPISSSPAIGDGERLLFGSDDHVLYCLGLAPPPTQTPPPTPTSTPNYINLSASPSTVHPGGTVTLSYSCDFNIWNYQGVAVDVYLAAIKTPRVVDAPSSLNDALGGGVVYLFGENMKSVYVYEGSVHEPTYGNVAFPLVATAGSLSVVVPASAGYAGDYVFATAFIRHGAGSFIRDDGLPVENSNMVTDTQ